VKYYENGHPRRESTGTEKETEARRFMKEWEGRVATGQPILRRADRISYEKVAQDLRQHYQTTGSRNLKEAEYCLKHLDAFFAGRRVSRVVWDQRRLRPTWRCASEKGIEQHDQS
jgi:hypothetical protein